jgi:outer membrane protein OmpA-like peptidoglycan-associated protein
VNEKNYFFSELIFSTKGKRKSQTLTENISIEKINYIKPYLWYGIAFTKNDYIVMPNTAVELNRLYELLKNNPSLRIELSCHTDSRGNDKDNLILSQKRADAAAGYLYTKGIEHSRIIAVGYGETHLLNECKNGILCLEEDHRINIRTEVKILSSSF